MTPPPRGDIQAKTRLLPIKMPGKSWHTWKDFPIKRLEILPRGVRQGAKRALRRGGVKTPGGMDLRGPGGPSRGGTPPGGGPGGGGPPPGGVKKGQKVAIQGGPLGLPPRPLQIPYEKWAGWPDFDPPPGGSSGGPPPSGGGFLAPPGLV